MQSGERLVASVQYGFAGRLLLDASGAADAKLRLVPYGDTADDLLLSRPDPDGIRFAVVPAPVGLRRAATVSPMPLADGDLSPHSASWSSPLDQSLCARLETLHVAAQSLFGAGLARRAVSMAAEYARERRQFGRPIGSFQALQHKLADLWVLEQSLGLLAYDAFSWRVGEDERWRRSRMAGEFAYQTLPQVMRGAQLVHGAIGITSEHDMQYFSRLGLHTTAAIRVTRHANWLADALVPA
jgi:hypothetical protein